MAAQEHEVKITPEGIEPVVVAVENLTAAELYDRAKTAVLKMFKNPDNVIKADIAGKLLRFQGEKFYSSGLSSEGTYRYTCQLEFKDNRYKVTFTEVTFLKKRHAKIQELVFNDKGELRELDYYKNIYNNCLTMVNTVFSDIKTKVTAPDDGW